MESDASVGSIFYSMVHVRPRPGALGLALLLLAGLGHAAVVPVSTAEEFLAALASVAAPDAPNDTVVELQQDVALRAEAAEASYTLPFVIPGNRTLTLAGADGQMKSLDFGEIPELLFFERGSKLFAEQLNISGMEDPQLGSWPDGVTSPTVVQSLPVWPTIGADPGVEASVRDVLMYLHPTDICYPEIGAVQYEALRQLAAAAGTNRTEIDFRGREVTLVNWSAPLPVLSRDTKVAIGTILVAANNATIYCRLPDNDTALAPAPAPSIAGSTGANSSNSGDSISSGSSSGGTSGGSSGAGSSSVDSESSGGSSGGAEGGGGGTPGWVWAVIGVAVALAVAAAAAGLVWRFRRKSRKQQEAQLDALNVLVPAAVSSEPASKSPKMSSLDRMWSGSLPSAGNSGILEFPGGKTILPEGPWKSRVGFIDGLQLGGLIGRGGYARVYKGRWKGTTVAVKVAETHVGPQQQYDLRDEPLLSLSLSHPNVLQGYKMCAVKVLTEPTDGDHHSMLNGSVHGSGNLHPSGGSHGPGHSTSGSGGRVVPHLTNPNCMVEVMPADAVLEPGMYEMWLVSELADKGTLADAMKSGLFKQADAPGRNLPVILLCLLDVARGLEYLHSCNIMHGDLKPQNVLLKTAVTDRRGFMCKLGDFGLSRILRETETHVNTGSYGTVTHASPELLSEGRLTKACDVFAFGIVLWELVTGQRLFPDMHHMQIIVQVTQKGYRPPIPADFPPPLADLVRRCWAEDPHARPSAGAIVQELIDYCTNYNAIHHGAAPPSSPPPADATNRAPAADGTSPVSDSAASTIAAAVAAAESGSTVAVDRDQPNEGAA